MKYGLLGSSGRIAMQVPAFKLSACSRVTLALYRRRASAERYRGAEQVEFSASAGVPCLQLCGRTQAAAQLLDLVAAGFHPRLFPQIIDPGRTQPRRTRPGHVHCPARGAQADAQAQGGCAGALASWREKEDPVTDLQGGRGHGFARMQWSRIRKNRGGKVVIHQWVIRGGICDARLW